MPGQTAQHVGRIVRLVVFTLASSALFVNTINAWAVRYPLIGVGLALLEVLYRTAVPVETVESLTSSGVHTVPADPGEVPRVGIDVPRNADGTFPAATVSNPPVPGQPPGAQITPEG
jgi:hypothetical protein